MKALKKIIIGVKKSSKTALMHFVGTLTQNFSDLTSASLVDF